MADMSIDRFESDIQASATRQALELRPRFSPDVHPPSPGF
jgi:hypothetical protein